MLTVSCPQCGAQIVFRSGESVFGVCEYCSTALTRDDVTVESIGTIAILNDYWSPLQVGTQGSFDGASFIALGRITLAWNAGSWNEWYLGYNDGRTGWVSEAQGFYAFSFECADAQPPNIGSIKVGAEWEYNGESFTIQDCKTVMVQYIEGELPFRTSLQDVSTSVDLTGQRGRFASISYSPRRNKEGETKVYIGRYEEFDRINFVNLRTIQGW